MLISITGAKPVLGLYQNALASFRVEESELAPQYQGKRIFVTGQHIDAYKTNSMATGYLSWSLAKADFENPDNYMSLSNIYNNFKKDMPDVIIDSENVIPNIFKNIPELAVKYNNTKKGIYVRI
jgi:uracil DNA glycosylase